MMNKEKTPIRKLAKYLLVLPLVMLLITANSVYAQQNNPQKVAVNIISADSSLVLEESYVSDLAVEGDSTSIIRLERNNKGKLIIRGLQDSISGKPFIIIDGMKMHKDFDLNDLNVNEIESISVLKDQIATSLYGYEAKDGVIVISTREVDKKENSAEPKEDIFVVVEEQPEFPGGNDEMKHFFAENIQYPTIAKDHGIEGRVIVNFVVEKDGVISNVQVVRGVDPSLDTEAIRVIESMPNWKPGIQRGEAVRVRFTLPVTFRLPTEGQVQEEMVINYEEDKAKENDNGEVFVVVENKPEFPGGNQGLNQFLAEYVQYPLIAKENGIQGRVIANFVVEKDGAISNIQIVRGVDPSLDMEATRVIEAMPNWKPGTQRGQAVRVRYTLPIVFRLPDTKTDDVPPPPPPPPTSDDKA